MGLNLPELAKIDYTTLDFDGIVGLTQKLIQDNPEYFNNTDDFTQSNAARMTVELVAYIVELLADRIDWVANELTLPTATQKQSVMNLLKLINYRLELPKAASTNITATINTYVDPFVIPSRYSVPGKDLDGNSVRFEMLKKDESDRYIYEGISSGYEFDTGYEMTPLLQHNDLVFYEGRSHQQFFNMEGINNETVMLENANVEEGSIRVYRVSRNTQGNIVSRRELTEVVSFISPEAQASSDSGLPPYKIQTTEGNSVYLVFGETPIVAIFNPGGTEEIMVWYRTTIGEKGNITRNSINYSTNLVIQGRNVQFTLFNSVSGTGGAKSESLEHAKRYGPLTLTTVNKTVNPDDFTILLQSFGPLINSITYGKSNEPPRIKADYGYHIPPYEAWIYALFNKSGWTTLPTYAYQKAMKLSRPYNKYGFVESETVIFDSIEMSKDLTKIHHHALDRNYRNVIVSNHDNSVQYMPGADFAIDLEGRRILRLEGGEIEHNSIVVIQYFENEDIIAGHVDFSTGDSQVLENLPIFPGMKTRAIRLDLKEEFKENTLSEGDFNWPNGDYTIDYTTGTIKKNSSFPELESISNFGIDSLVTAGINNQFILAMGGLDNPSMNSDHDFVIDCFSGYHALGNGEIPAFISGDLSFKIQIDDSEIQQYKFTTTGNPTPRELVDLIKGSTNTLTAKPFTDLEVEVFTDSIRYPAGGHRLTFMSKTTGTGSSVTITNGDWPEHETLLQYNLSSVSDSGNGEEVDSIEIAKRCRATLNRMGLLSSWRGQTLPVNTRDFPEVYSKANFLTPSSFTLTSVANSIKIELSGTNLGEKDGEHTIVFPEKTWDLTSMQGKLDLIIDLQEEINIGIAQDVVEVFWVRAANSYRIGLRQKDVHGNAENWIKIFDSDTNSARSIFQFSEGQSSLDQNTVEAFVSDKSNMIDNFRIRFVLYSFAGDDSLLQIKANSAVHNNTLFLLKYGDNQISRGSSILSKTLPAEYDLISDGGLIYTFDSTNNIFLIELEGVVGIEDQEYEITIPEASYNITNLISTINTALHTAESNGETVDLSSVLKIEKQEAEQRLRIVALVEQNEAFDVRIPLDLGEIEYSCTTKLGFVQGKSMSQYSTIMLNYCGDWISNKSLDQSEENSIVKYLEDKRLISQDYIVKDSILTSFDIKGKVYCSKGFDREIIKHRIKSRIREAFKIDNREYADSAAITNITRHIEEEEGTVYSTMEYFGKDYQKYRSYQSKFKFAEIYGRAPIDLAAERWSEKSAFKITLDGSRRGGVNYDGEYLVEIGNNWASGDISSFMNVLLVGDGTVGGIQNAIPLAIGKYQTNIGPALRVSNYGGFIYFSSINEGPSVKIKIENPDRIQTSGYQNFSRTTEILESEYIKDSQYTFSVSINGGTLTDYYITSPESGDWPLDIIAEQMRDVLPSNSTASIDSHGKIRITSLTPGNSSTVSTGLGDTVSAITIIPLLGDAEDQVNGSHGYVDCISVGYPGSINIGEQTVFGAEKDPDPEKMPDAYNHKDEIKAKYNEILYISDDYYRDEIEEADNQTHGIILELFELGREND